MKTLLSILTFLGTCMPSPPAQAKMFQNAYISFEIRDDWDCTARAPEWICRSKNPQEAREAAIILTAKEIGPTDTWELYKTHMGTSQTVQMKNGSTLNSRVVYAPVRNQYNGQPWLDGLHQDGELRNYFTRYLATLKDQIAVLVTFSAHNRFYSKYSADFAKTIQSLRIIAPKNFGSSKAGGGESMGMPNIGGNPSEAFGNDDANGGQGSAGGNEKMMGFGILIAAILGYVGYRYYSSQKKS